MSYDYSIPTSGQIRAFDYGSDYTHEKFISLIRSTNNYGVCSGFNIIVNGTNSIYVGSGAAVFYPGVCIEMNGNTSMTIESPEDETVFTFYFEYEFQTIIGSKASGSIGYVVEDITERENSVILGWIRHPGNGGEFKQSYVIPNTKYRMDYVLSNMVNPDSVLLPPFNCAPFSSVPNNSSISYEYEEDSEGGAGVVTQKGYIGAGLQDRQDLKVACVSFYKANINPVYFDVKVKASYGATVKFTLYDTSGTVVGSHEIVGDGSTWKEETFDVISTSINTWEARKTFTVEITYQLQPNEWGKIAYMRLRPFKNFP